MKIETAEIVALIGHIVNTNWEHLDKDKRLQTMQSKLSCKSLLNIDTLNIDLDYGETIVLTIDGDLGVYYTSIDDPRESIRIELLTRRQVKVTETYTIDIPCFKSTKTSDLLAMVDDYEHVFINSTIEELK